MKTSLGSLNAVNVHGVPSTSNTRQTSPLLNTGVDTVCFSGTKKPQLKQTFDDTLGVYYDPKLSDENKQLLSKALQEFEESDDYKNRKNRPKGKIKLPENLKFVFGQLENGKPVIGIGTLENDHMEVFGSGLQQARKTNWAVKSVIKRVYNDAIGDEKVK